jgi:hypothetical protein
MFHGDFPCGDSAEEHLVCRINKQFASTLGKLGGISDDPKEGAGVEKNSHGFSP